MSKRLDEIHRKNAAFEKEAPYNFCDRWCERCDHEKQIRCTLYKDELERKVTCIAHGKEPDDPEMSAEIMEKQYEELGGQLEESAEELGIDLDQIDDSETEKMEEHKKLIENDPLNKTARQYLLKAHAFLKYTLFKKGFAKPEFLYDFETVAWYHTLLPVKLHRALSGLHELDDAEEFGVCDAVAQFQVCKKAALKSIESLRRIGQGHSAFLIQIHEMLALLHNIHSRIVKLEEDI